MRDGNDAPFSTDDDIHSTRNRILKALPKDECERLLPFLEAVPLPYGKFIYHAEERINHVYFPVSGLISITSVMPNGRTVEIAMVGNEGMAGIDLILGADSTPYETMVQMDGAGFRIKAEVIKKEFEKCGVLQKLLLRYTRALLIQGVQGGACHRLHAIEQKLATWLMTCRDRAESDILPFTQEFMAAMLGVQRPTVSMIAGKIQNDGIIEYTRGNFNILDPKRLEDLTCDCYRVIKAGYVSLIVQ